MLLGHLAKLLHILIVHIVNTLQRSTVLFVICHVWSKRSRTAWVACLVIFQLCWDLLVYLRLGFFIKLSWWITVGLFNLKLLCLPLIVFLLAFLFRQETIVELLHIDKFTKEDLQRQIAANKKHFSKVTLGTVRHRRCRLDVLNLNFNRLKRSLFPYATRNLFDELRLHGPR